MSRFNPHLENAKFVYEAAERWRDTCLLQDGSVFSDKNLWTRENLNDEFVRELIKCMFQRDFLGNFFDRLILQLEDINSSPEMYQLMAEFLWIMYLATSKGGMKASTKRARIQKMWKKSGAELPDHKYLQDKYMGGIGNPGLGYRNNMWRELITLILFTCEIKNFSNDKQKRLLANKDGKEISIMWDDWVVQWDNECVEFGSLYAKYRQTRHILFHLVFPDYFERIFSGSDKISIIKAFKKFDPSGEPWSEIDGILQTIRADKEKEYGPDIDFYSKPLDRMWGSRKNKKLKAIKESEPPPSLPSLSNIPLNQIFYGPPGTGKTYHVIDATLEIIDPEFYNENKKNRGELRRRFNKLRNDGQVEFITFHQSFGYEEFVEGIRPVMDDEISEQAQQEISYKIESGVFKNICQKAARVYVKAGDSSYHPGETATVWKISLGAGGAIKDECFADNTIRIGCPRAGDLRNPDEIGQEYLNSNPGARSILEQFKEISPGDLVAVLHDNKHINAVGIATSEYEYTKEKNEMYPHSHSVEWIYKGEPLNILGLNGGKPLTMRACYELFRISAKDLLELIDYKRYKQESQPHVLIIDEINRGNISKIFGELITLIEESKRVGKGEETWATLPYSRTPFGVPSNLYIIGTMNTADRSIALLDTALRRRFRFEEMMPKYGALNDINVDGVNIGKLLKTINERIEALYDRDHQIGHSYFLPLKDSPNIKTLKDIFLYEILPLLQEYFYDDWEKIHAILNKNPFLEWKKLSGKKNSKYLVDSNKKLWRINTDLKVFDGIQNYQTIIHKDKNDAETDNST